MSHRLHDRLALGSHDGVPGAREHAERDRRHNESRQQPKTVQGTGIHHTTITQQSPPGKPTCIFAVNEYTGDVTTPKRKLRALASLGIALTLISAITAGAVAIPTYWLGSRAIDATDVWNDIETDMTVFDTPLAQKIEIVDVNGTPFATLFTENRVPLDSLDQVSPHMIDAVLSVEDRGFYAHGPIDPRGTTRAVVRNVTTDASQGGSSITQQYVKLMRAASGQDAKEKAEASADSLNRKLVELKYATELEAIMGKDEILLGYLNTAYFGDGAYGIGAAAMRYFGVPAADLNVPQSAMLAGLLRNPVGYNPVTHPEEGLARRNVALGTMAANGVITEAERAQYAAEPVGAVSNPIANGCATSAYPYYCDWVKQVLLTDPAFGADDATRERNLYVGGFTVRTALNPGAMAAAQESVDRAVGRQDAAAAIAIVEPGTGYVPAIAASRDYATTQFNIPVQAQLQIGSTFKPITYAAALSRGFSPAATLSAPHPYTPASGNAPAGGFKNVDATSRGPITAREAMKFSVNTWFVKLAEQTGTQAIADTAYDLGMRSMSPATRSVGAADLSLTLGAFETTVLDTANVYATFAASGVACTPTPIVTVTSFSGEDRAAPERNCHQAIQASVADTVTAATSATGEDGGTADVVSIDGHPWVGKTGTTNFNGATWFAGYTRTLAAAVWVGDPRGPSYTVNGTIAYGERIRTVYGSSIAAPIFNEAMNRFMAGSPAQGFPAPGPITPTGTALPSVIGLDLAAARSVLKIAGSTIAEVRQVEATGAQSPGTVVAQTPSGGTTAGATVTLDVIKEP